MFQAEKKERFHDLVTFVKAYPIKKMAKGVEKPGIEIAYIPIYKDGRTHQGEPWKKNAFADSLKGCKNVLQSLREGDAITLELTVNGNYKNLAGVIAGHIENPNPILKARSPNNSGNSFAKVPKTDYNERAAKGQALNLAFQVAIAEGRQGDDNYILSLIPRMLKLGEAVQNADKELQAVNNVYGNASIPKDVQGRENQVEKAPRREEGGIPAQSQGSSDIIDNDINDLFGGI